MRTISLVHGAGAVDDVMPVLGLGTWRFGESAARRAAEVEAVRAAFALGYRLIDTAEMYGDGGAEEVVGAALADGIAARELTRNDVFIVSKVYPHNAGRSTAIDACERSLRRLRVEMIDLYLLHWRGSVPLTETIAAFEQLRAAGKIRRWGVSNFDVADLDELAAQPSGGGCATNQVYYSASERGVEFALLPRQRALKMPLMAYCPIDQGTLAANAALAQIGRPLGASAAQVALAWVLRHPDVVAIPKAVRLEHLRENIAAAQFTLGADDLAAIDRLFPPPRRAGRLAVI